MGYGSVRVEIEADVVEPFGDQVFVAGIEDIGIVEQQNRGPVDQVALRDRPKRLCSRAFEICSRVMTMPGSGIGNRLFAERRWVMPLVVSSFGIEVDVESPGK